MRLDSELLYSFYADDFTGSTDVLEQLASHGVAAVLFLGLPTAEHRARFPGVRAIGVAGDSRSRTPEWMSENLPGVFAVLQSFGAQVAHYKVCSTFDSSPERGSIGRALEIGMRVFGGSFVPIVVGAPHLGRYVAFGNLFAAGPDGVVTRIDRGVMRRHPVTPMLEADLRVHLAAQTEMRIGLVDLTMLQGEAIKGDGVVLFDTVDVPTQALAGETVWARRPLFAVGSSGLTAALALAWRRAGLIPSGGASEAMTAAGPLLVVSGSCSAATERQLRYALAHGYHGIAVDPAAMHAADVVGAAVRSLESGRDTVLYTAIGDPLGELGGERLGTALGGMLREILKKTTVRRVLLCGGDTASHAVQELGLYALTWLGAVQPGAPLCRGHADGELDGLELVLKGGQVGTEDFFDRVKG